jgi:hypothetical protein
MPSHRVSATAEVMAPAGKVYAIIADYDHGHPQIVPRPPFGSLEVEQSGSGAGTVIRYQMRVMGRTQTFRAAIAEPEPGRVLVETDLTMGAVTTFTVDPIEEGRHARVTISTELKVRGGLLGMLERAVTTRFLRPTYIRELENLASLAEGRSSNLGSAAAPVARP